MSSYSATTRGTTDMNSTGQSDSHRAVTEQTRSLKLPEVCKAVLASTHTSPRDARFKHHRPPRVPSVRTPQEAGFPRSQALRTSLHQGNNSPQRHAILRSEKPGVRGQVAHKQERALLGLKRSEACSLRE